MLGLKMIQKTNFPTITGNSLAIETISVNLPNARFAKRSHVVQLKRGVYHGSDLFEQDSEWREMSRLAGGA